MSQRECAGFNWPPLGIPAQEPVSISPETVSRAGCGTSLNASLTVAERSIVTFDPSGMRPVIETPGRKPFPPDPSLAAVVGHGAPVEPVSDVRSTDARSRERDRPDPVSQTFQVILYKVDPRVCVATCNLLSKDRCRAPLRDEVMEGGPEMPLVIKPSARACRAERLARAGTGPNRSVIGPAGTPQGQAPYSDAGEEVALGESAQVGGVNIFNAPFVHHPWRDVPGSDEVAQPLSRVLIDLVVVSGHGSRNAKGPQRGRRAWVWWGVESRRCRRYSTLRNKGVPYD